MLPGKTDTRTFRKAGLALLLVLVTLISCSLRKSLAVHWGVSYHEQLAVYKSTVSGTSSCQITADPVRLEKGKTAVNLPSGILSPGLQWIVQDLSLVPVQLSFSERRSLRCLPLYIVFNQLKIAHTGSFIG